MASEKLCEFWKADRYGEGKGGCYAAGEEGNIVCLTEGELGDEPLPDCTSYPFGITADRDRERARADEAEKDAERLAEALRFCTSAYGRDRFGDAIVPLRAMDKGEFALRAHEARKEGK